MADRSSFCFKSNELVFIVNDSESKILLYGSEFDGIVEGAKSKFENRGLAFRCVADSPVDGVPDYHRLMRESGTAPTHIASTTLGVAASLLKIFFA